MTLSCRAQAFSVDNLLKPSTKTPTRPTAPTPISTLAPTCTQSTLTGSSEKDSTADSSETFETVGDRKDELLQHTARNGHTLFTLGKDIRKLSTPEIYYDTNRFRSEDDESSKTPKYIDSDGSESDARYDVQNVTSIRKVSELSAQNLKVAINNSSNDSSTPSTIPSESKKLNNLRPAPEHRTSSCFCHGEINFCHHSGLVSIPDSNGSENSILVELCHADLWMSFHRLGTEMIITKSGRRMFPALKLRVSGLDPDRLYSVKLEFLQPDSRKYRYIYHSSRWMVSGSGDTLASAPCHMTPEGPISGQAICSQIVSFERLKLTNTETTKPGQVSLVSMQKFQPQVVVESIKEESDDIEHTERYVILFPQTSFMAVTAYQNQQITTLKIASNPFAKGFRESGKSRIPYEALMSPFPSLVACDSSMVGFHQRMITSPFAPAIFQRGESNLSGSKRCHDGHSYQSQYELEKPVKITRMEESCLALIEPGDVIKTGYHEPSTLFPNPRHHFSLSGLEHLLQHHQHHGVTPALPQSLQHLSHYPNLTPPLSLTASEMERHHSNPRTSVHVSAYPPPAHMSHRISSLTGSSSTLLPPNSVSAAFAPFAPKKNTSYDLTTTRVIDSRLWLDQKNSTPEARMESRSPRSPTESSDASSIASLQIQEQNRTETPGTSYRGSVCGSPVTARERSAEDKRNKPTTGRVEYDTQVMQYGCDVVPVSSVAQWQNLNSSHLYIPRRQICQPPD